MPIVNERNVGPNGQALLHAFGEGVSANIGCNNGGQEWRFKNNSRYPVTVIYGVMKINDPSSQRYETFIVPGVSETLVSCTKSNDGSPIQIRMAWAYANTDYLPAEIDNPWDSLLILVGRTGGRALNNLSFRQINVTIKKQNGQEELRAIGADSVWGSEFSLRPGWSVIAASWAT